VIWPETNRFSVPAEDGSFRAKGLGQALESFCEQAFHLTEPLVEETAQKDLVNFRVRHFLSMLLIRDSLICSGVFAL